MYIWAGDIPRVDQFVWAPERWIRFWWLLYIVICHVISRVFLKTILANLPIDTPNILGAKFLGIMLPIDPGVLHILRILPVRAIA